MRLAAGAARARAVAVGRPRIASISFLFFFIRKGAKFSNPAHVGGGSAARGLIASWHRVFWRCRRCALADVAAAGRCLLASVDYSARANTHLTWGAAATAGRSSQRPWRARAAATRRACSPPSSVAMCAWCGGTARSCATRTYQRLGTSGSSSRRSRCAAGSSPPSPRSATSRWCT